MGDTSRRHLALPCSEFHFHSDPHLIQVQDGCLKSVLETVGLGCHSEALDIRGLFSFSSRLYWGWLDCLVLA